MEVTELKIMIDTGNDQNGQDEYHEEMSTSDRQRELSALETKFEKKGCNSLDMFGQA